MVCIIAVVLAIEAEEEVAWSMEVGVVCHRQVTTVEQGGPYPHWGITGIVKSMPMAIMPTGDMDISIIIIR